MGSNPTPSATRKRQCVGGRPTGLVKQRLAASNILYSRGPRPGTFPVNFILSDLTVVMG